MKYYVYIVLLVLLICFQQVVRAQNPVVDSLKLALKNAKNDTTRIAILSELSDNCELNDILLYAEPLKLLCEQGLKKNNLNAKLIYFYNKHLSLAFYNISFFEKNKGNDSNSLQYLKKSIAISEKIKDVHGLATAYNVLGIVYDNIGDIKLALHYYHKSLKLMESINDKSGISVCLNSIGALYKDQGELEEGLKYMFKSLEIANKINDKKLVARTLNNIGTIISLNNNKKAIDYFNESIMISKSINDQEGISLALGNLSSAYCDLGDLNKGLELINKNLIIQKKLNLRHGIAYSYHCIGTIYSLQGKLGVAYEYSKKGLNEIRSIGYPLDIIDNAKELKVICLKQGKFQEALEMYELEILMRDSINNEETKKASIKKQFQYEYEKQAAADSVKHAEEQKVKNALLVAQSASLKQEKTQRYALYGGLLLVIGFSVFVFNRFRVTQKQKKVIEDQKVLVDRAYEQLHEKNKEVMDSIHYARRIQRALVTSEKYIEKQLNRLNKNA